METTPTVLMTIPVPRASSLDLIAGGAAFTLVMAVWTMLIVFWYRRRSQRQEQLRRRLGADGRDVQGGRVLHLWRGGQEATVAVPAHRARPSAARWLDDLRLRAGWRAGPSALALMLLAAMLSAFTVSWLWTHRLVPGLLAAAAALPAFWVWLQRCISLRASTFDRQLLDALDLAVRSLRANHPLLGAMQLVSEEVPAPVGPLFGQICQQQALGMRLDEALRQTAARTRHPEFSLFATCVAIQLRSGGHLADMVERLALVIRDRLRLGRRVRVLTAQVQLSKRILLVLPFLMFIVLIVASPDYISILYTSAMGRIMLLVGGLSLTAGAFLMNRMARLAY